MSTTELPLQIGAAPQIPETIGNGTKVAITGNLSKPCPPGSAALVICHGPNGHVVWADSLDPMPIGESSFVDNQVAGGSPDWMPGAMYTVTVYYFPAESPGEFPIIYVGTFIYSG